MEKEIQEECFKIFRDYVDSNKTDLSAIAPQFAGDIADIKSENLIVGERPQFRKYKFSVTVRAPVVADMPYYDWSEQRRKTKSQLFYNMLNQPFEGYCWLMDNEENSDISICNNNADLVNQHLHDKEIFKKFYALSEKKKAAEFVGKEEANTFVLLSTAHLPKQAYVEFVMLNDNFKCEATKFEPVQIPLLPVYLKLKNGEKVLIGTYIIEENKFIVDFYKKETEDYRTKKAAEEKKKKEKIKKFSGVASFVVSVAVVLLIVLPKVL